MTMRSPLIPSCPLSLRHAVNWYCKQPGTHPPFPIAKAHTPAAIPATPHVANTSMHYRGTRPLCAAKSPITEKAEWLQCPTQPMVRGMTCIVEMGWTGIPVTPIPGQLPSCPVPECKPRTGSARRTSSSLDNSHVPVGYHELNLQPCVRHLQSNKHARNPERSGKTVARLLRVCDAHEGPQALHPITCVQVSGGQLRCYSHSATVSCKQQRPLVLRRQDLS